jgi:hypothetical protein
VGVAVLLFAGSAAAGTSATPCPLLVGGKETLVCVGSRLLAKPTVDHWIYVAAKGEALARSPRAPVIAPTDPPNFRNCEADVRRLVPSKRGWSTTALRGYCTRRFQSLSSQALDLLIWTYWYEKQAAFDHIVVTATQVRQRLAREEHQQFASTADFQAYLQKSGQTVQDILFRIRETLVFSRLLARSSGEDALNQSVRARWQPRTFCRQYYVVLECGGTFTKPS